MGKKGLGQWQKKANIWGWLEKEKTDVEFNISKAQC